VKLNASRSREKQFTTEAQSTQRKPGSCKQTSFPRTSFRVRGTVPARRCRTISNRTTAAARKHSATALCPASESKPGSRTSLHQVVQALPSPPRTVRSPCCSRGRRRLFGAFVETDGPHVVFFQSSTVRAMLVTLAMGMCSLAPADTLVTVPVTLAERRSESRCRSRRRHRRCAGSLPDCEDPQPRRARPPANIPPAWR